MKSPCVVAWRGGRDTQTLINKDAMVMSIVGGERVSNTRCD